MIWCGRRPRKHFPIMLYINTLHRVRVFCMHKSESDSPWDDPLIRRSRLFFGRESATDSSKWYPIRDSAPTFPPLPRTGEVRPKAAFGGDTAASVTSCLPGPAWPPTRPKAVSRDRSSPDQTMDRCWTSARPSHQILRLCGTNPSDHQLRILALSDRSNQTSGPHRDHARGRRQYPRVREGEANSPTFSLLERRNPACVDQSVE